MSGPYPIYIKPSIHLCLEIFIASWNRWLGPSLDCRGYGVRYTWSQIYTRKREILEAPQAKFAGTCKNVPWLQLFWGADAVHSKMHSKPQQDEGKPEPQDTLSCWLHQLPTSPYWGVMHAGIGVCSLLVMKQMNKNKCTFGTGKNTEQLLQVQSYPCIREKISWNLGILQGTKYFPYMHYQVCNNPHRAELELKPVEANPKIICRCGRDIILLVEEMGGKPVIIIFQSWPALIVMNRIYPLVSFSFLFISFHFIFIFHLISLYLSLFLSPISYFHMVCI